MIRFRRLKNSGLEINMAPLVDMVFLLLIFFLLSSSFLQPSIRLDLPSARSNTREERQEIFITVDRNENIFVNLDRVTLATLGKKP